MVSTDTQIAKQISWYLPRLVTLHDANINLAFTVWPGWENQFPSYFWYVVMLLPIAAVSFGLLEFFIRKWMRNNGKMRYS
jgi:hypothetical protein